jgi:hypothetical protein
MVIVLAKAGSLRRIATKHYSWPLQTNTNERQMGSLRKARWRRTSFHYLGDLSHFPVPAKMQGRSDVFMFPVFAVAKLLKTAVAAAESKPKQKEYSSGSKAPASGIYRCAGCSNKRTVMKGRKLPPCHSAWIVVEKTT